MSRIVLAALFLICMSTTAFAGHLTGYPAPTNLSATPSGNQVTLTWDAYSSFPIGCDNGRNFRIFRNDGSGFNLIITVDFPGTTYLDEDLAAGNHDYQIQARCSQPADPNNLSLFSNTATVSILSAPPCQGPPTIAAVAAPTLLWPPNGKMVAVAVTGTVAAQPNCVAPNSVDYYIVDEYGELSSGPFNAALSNNSYSLQVSLEASRRGDDRDGRMYTIHIHSVGGDGGTTEESVNVIVPHDQRKK